MNVVDLHPEDLLDKDARGVLSSDERVRLDAHLARCSACRAERVLRADFADELDGEDRPSALIGLVQGALAAPRTAATAPTTTPEPALDDETRADLAAVPSLRPIGAIGALRRRPRRRTTVFLLVAAAVLAAGAAGATGVTGRVWRSIGGGSLETTHSSESPILTAPVAQAAPPALPALPAAVVPVVPVEEPAPVVAPIACAAPVAVAPVLPPAVPAARVPALAAAPAAAVPASSAALAPVSASSLFDSANAARRMGDTPTALARYDALEKQFPGTREARVAKATTAKLLLDRGDASGALSRFDTYLASGSTELREEAMAGRATALERLGRDEDETRAWAALLATYPRTPYASHARARVGRSVPQ